MAGCLDVNPDIERYKYEAIPLEPNVERFIRSHFDEARHLVLSADNEQCKKILCNSCAGIQLDSHAEDRRHKDSLCHCDIHLSHTQESSHQGSPSQHYVGFDEVTAVRRLTESASPDSELDNDSLERGRYNSNVCSDARKDADERTTFDVDSDLTERPVNNSTYCAEHDNGMFGRRPLGNCIDVYSDTFERRPVNNTTDSFEDDNEADDRRPSDSSKHSDVNLENVAATKRHIDGTTGSDDFDIDNDAREKRPLENNSYSTEPPDMSSSEWEQLDGHIYYELDLDTGAIFELRDSSGGTPSVDERQELGQSSRVKDHGVRHDCLVCFESRTTVSRRRCCKFPVCHICLETYYATKVSVASVQVQCIGSGCSKYVSQAEIMNYLTADLQDRYMRLLVDANRDPRRKTCPRCSHITEVDPEMLKGQGNQKYGLRCVCSICSLIWCFKCQAPWHEPLSCREYQHGDRQFKTWTKEQLDGQANAQKCPKCKVYIQRNGGCDHMTCLRCSTDFCYQCGEKYRKLKFVGDHRSPYSILGCKYRYKPNSPVKRRLVRGSIFGGKLLAAPIVGGLALGAGAVVVGLGLVALPFYGGYRLHKLMKQKRMAREEKSWRAFMGVEVEKDYDRFELDEFGHVLARYYGDDNDEYNMEIYSLATSINEESAECENNQSPLQQSDFEVSSEAGTFDVEATGSGDTGALNSDRLNLPADPTSLDSFNVEAEAATVARTGVKIPRRFGRTCFSESAGLGMKKNAGSNEIGKPKNLSSSQDVAKDDEIVEACDQVTHL